MQNYFVDTIDVDTAAIWNGGGLLTDVTFNNSGDVNQSSPAGFSLTRSTVNNLVTGVWTLPTSGYTWVSGTDAMFNNSGTMIANLASGNGFIDVPFSNLDDGTFVVQSGGGDVHLNRAGTHSGTFDINNGGELLFINDHNFIDGPTHDIDFIGTGTVRFLASTFDFAAGTTYSFGGSTQFENNSITTFQTGAVADFEDLFIDGSTLDITTTTATISGQFDWIDGGTITGSGGVFDPKYRVNHQLGAKPKSKTFPT